MILSREVIDGDIRSLYIKLLLCLQCILSLWNSVSILTWTGKLVAILRFGIGQPRDVTVQTPVLRGGVVAVPGEGPCPRRAALGAGRGAGPGAPASIHWESTSL